MDDELITQVVQIPYREGRTRRTDEIVREVAAATGLETAMSGFAALFRGEAPSHAALQAMVEVAMPPDWHEHFYDPLEAEHGVWPAGAN